jgi:hypothetical protein
LLQRLEVNLRSSVQTGSWDRICKLIHVRMTLCYVEAISFRTVRIPDDFGLIVTLYVCLKGSGRLATEDVVISVVNS